MDNDRIYQRVCVTWSVMLLMLLVSMPEICTLGHTRLAGVNCRWIPSRVVRPSGRETVRSPAAKAQRHTNRYFTIQRARRENAKHIYQKTQVNQHEEQVKQHRGVTCTLFWLK